MSCARPRIRASVVATWACGLLAAAAALLVPLGPSPANADLTEHNPHVPLADAEAALTSVGGAGQGYRLEESRRFALVTDAPPDQVSAALLTLETTADRFLSSMRSMGVSVRAPARRLVMILHAEEMAFREFALRTEGVDAAWMGGYYSPARGWAVVYDESQAQWANAAKWEGHDPDAITQMAEEAMRIKVAHEGVHLLAFATGIERFDDRHPDWLSEGLAESLSRGRLSGSPADNDLTEYACERAGERYESWLARFDQMVAHQTDVVARLLTRDSRESRHWTAGVDVASQYPDGR